MPSHQYLPYDPERQIKEDEEMMAKDAVRGIFLAMAMIGSAGVGAFFAIYAEDSYHSAHPPQVLNKETSGMSPEYSFVNPVLFSEGDKSEYSEFGAFDNELAGYIAEAKKKGMAQSVSVYFRDLSSGHWTGINEDDKYHAENISKIMTMLGYIKNSVKNPAILSQEMQYRGEYYSAQKLIHMMIANSDDTAENILDAANPEYVSATYTDLHLPQVSNIVSVKQFSSIFRTLYNSTYLSSNLSEQTLQILASTSQNQGIVAGMRSGIAADMDDDTNDIHSDIDASSTTIVSHMFGEYTDKTTSGAILDREAYDCGVVYFPTRPYLLCTMTKGSDFQALSGAISTISRLTYNYVDGQ